MNQQRPAVTVTSEGQIPHLRHGDLLLPVKCQRQSSSQGYRLRTDLYGRPLPVRDDAGRLVYALPGGEDFIDIADRSRPGLVRLAA